jgi:hypothetical protein
MIALLTLLASSTAAKAESGRQPFQKVVDKQERQEKGNASEGLDPGHGA